MSEHKISEPIGIQSADVLEWTKTLRSRSPSPTRQGTRSRSPSPGRLSKSLQNTPRKGNLYARLWFRHEIGAMFCMKFVDM